MVFITFFLTLLWIIIITYNIYDIYNNKFILSKYINFFSFSIYYIIYIHFTSE